MTNGTAAALLFRDIILKEKNKFRELYTPSRFHMNPSLKNFLVENANVVGHLIKGKLEIPQNVFVIYLTMKGLSLILMDIEKELIKMQKVSFIL